MRNLGCVPPVREESPHLVPADVQGYADYFECFDAGRHFEAHEVLETVWLRHRRGPDGDFFKGLIQLAGAFVHVQKNRREPALALLGRATFHVRPYAPRRHGLELGAVLDLIEQWSARVRTAEVPARLLESGGGPRLAAHWSAGGPVTRARPGADGVLVAGTCLLRPPEYGVNHV